MKNNIILRVIDGLLDQEKYMLLKKLAAANDGMRIFILPVSPDDEDTLADMVTSAAFFLDKEMLDSVCGNNVCCSLIKKMCVAVKYMISGYKTVVDYGEGREERDCTLSIKTPSAHIHVPLGLNDKRTERLIATALAEAKQLDDDGKSEMLAYYDADKDKLIIESKDDYVRRKYFDSGLAQQMADSESKA